MSCFIKSSNTRSFHEPRYVPLKNPFINEKGDVPEEALKRSNSSGGYIPYNLDALSSEISKDVSPEVLPMQCQLAQCSSRSTSPWSSRSRSTSQGPSRSTSPSPYHGLSRSSSPCPYSQHPSALTTPPLMPSAVSSTVQANWNTCISFNADAHPSQLHSLPLSSTSMTCEVWEIPDFDMDQFSTCASPRALPMDLSMARQFAHESGSTSNSFACPLLSSVPAPFAWAHHVPQQPNLCTSAQPMSVDASSSQHCPKWPAADWSGQQCMAAHGNLMDTAVSSWVPAMPAPLHDANVPASRPTLSLDVALEPAIPNCVWSLPPSCDALMMQSARTESAVCHMPKAQTAIKSKPLSKQDIHQSQSLQGSCAADMCASEQPVTTLMIQNLPRHITQGQLVDELNNSGFEGTYDFAYMPSAFHNNENAGFAFVNFMNPCMAGILVGQWHRKRLFGIDGKQKALSITPAALQGFQANLQKWATPRLRRIKNQEFRPLIFDERTKSLRSLTDEVFDQVVNGMRALQ